MSRTHHLRFGFSPPTASCGLLKGLEELASVDLISGPGLYTQVFFFFKLGTEVSKLVIQGWQMAQNVKVFTGNPKDLSSIPGTHVVKGEDTAYKSSSDLHTCPFQ